MLLTEGLELEDRLKPEQVLHLSIYRFIYLSTSRAIVDDDHCYRIDVDVLINQAFTTKMKPRLHQIFSFNTNSSIHLSLHQVTRLTSPRRSRR